MKDIQNLVHKGSIRLVLFSLSLVPIPVFAGGESAKTGSDPDSAKVYCADPANRKIAKDKRLGYSQNGYLRGYGSCCFPKKTLLGSVIADDPWIYAPIDVLYYNVPGLKNFKDKNSLDEMARKRPEEVQKAYFDTLDKKCAAIAEGK